MRQSSLRIAAAAAFAFVAFASSYAFAAKTHCRSIELSGAAGPASADKVELQVTDYLGNVLDRSCQVTVQPNECADDLAKRLVATWGNGAQGGSQVGCGLDQGSTLTCGKNLDLVPLIETDTDVSRIFCKHKYKAGKVVGGKAALAELASLGLCPQPPPDGEKAEYKEFKKFPTIEVCCYEADPAVVSSFNYLDTSHCKGSKLGKTLTIPQRVEVSLFDRIDRPNVAGDGIYFEPKLPSNELDVPVGTSSRLISLDPIGFTQRPSPQNAGCRSDLATAAAALGRTAASVLTRCHLEQIENGGALPGIDCNQIAQADAKAVVPVAEQALRDAAAADCEGPDVATTGARISPAVFGLRTCPAPCEGIVVGTCSAGLVGNACSADRECDTEPGAADGRCGDWDDAADCVACLQTSAATTAVSSMIGAVPRPLILKEEVGCVRAVTKAYAALASTVIKDMLACQKRADGAKAALAPGRTCKTADLKGLRAAAEAKARSLLEKACLFTDVSSLQLCSGATTVSQLGDCVVEAAKDTVQALAAGVHPENAQAPGACPASADLTLVAGASGSCTIDAHCITGQCVGGKCVTNTALELGWTGSWHDNDIADKVEMDLGLSCAAAEAPCGTCSITGLQPTSGNCRCANDSTVRCNEPFSADADDCGGAQCRCFLEPPMPLAGGGMPLCAMAEHAAQVTGTIDVDSGALSASADLALRLYFGISPMAPCPTCDGDGLPNDGIASGTCNGGARDGLSCDAQATDPTFGPVSLDCTPSGGALISGAGHGVDLELSTGPASLPFAIPCDPPLGVLNCACGQCSGDPTIACRDTSDCTSAGAGTCTANTGALRQPNTCNDGSCDPVGGGRGECAGDADTFCDGFTRPSGAGVLPCVSQPDCDALDPQCPGGDCGTCSLLQPRACFLDPVDGGGVLDAASPTYGAAFCMTPTTSPAANGTIGLPGPGRVRLHALPTYLCSSSPSEAYTPGVGGCPP